MFAQEVLSVCGLSGTLCLDFFDLPHLFTSTLHPLATFTDVKDSNPSSTTSQQCGLGKVNFLSSSVLIIKMGTGLLVVMRIK